MTARILLAIVGLAAAGAVALRLSYDAGVELGLCLEACAVSDDDQVGEASGGECWCRDGAIKTGLTPTFTKLHTSTAAISAAEADIDSGRFILLHNHGRNR